MRERVRSAPPVGHVYSSVMITGTSTHAGFNVQLASLLISLLEELGRHQFCNLDRQNSLKPGVFSLFTPNIGGPCTPRVVEEENRTSKCLDTRKRTGGCHHGNDPVNTGSQN